MYLLVKLKFLLKFTQIDLLKLIYSNFRSTPLVQLLALVYKDQHVGTLERLLNIWLESSLSDSSGDDESNTSPQHIQDGICSSSLLTSTEPNSTDDSSDGNGGNSNGVDERSVSSDKGTCGSKCFFVCLKKSGFIFFLSSPILISIIV